MNAVNIIILGIVGAAAIASYLIGVSSLFPDAVEKIRHTLEERQGRLFLIGLVNVLFLAGILAGIVWLTRRTGIGQWAGIPGLLVMAFFLVGSSAGLAGTMRLLAERLSPEASTTRAQVLAAIVLILACALPYLGWYLFLPYVTLSGFGSFIAVLFRHLRPEKAEAEDGSGK